MGKKAHRKETIKQIATTGTYNISIYVGSADEEFINDLKQSLDDEKYELIGFESDGKKLIKNIKKSSPNILLLDTELKNLDHSKINSAIEKLNIPQVVVIDDMTDEIMELITSGNLFVYVIKPVDMEELVRAIDVCVKNTILMNLKP